MRNILLIITLFVTIKLYSVDISSLMEPIRQKYQVPSMSAAIIYNDETIAVWTDGLRAKTQPLKVTPNDLFHLGSNTKAMTSTLIGILVERGLLKWDTKVIDLFPELIGKINAQYNTLTLEQLLTHTGGLPKDINYWPIHAISPTHVIAARNITMSTALSGHLATVPGNYLYSNLGYIIAGHMAEKVTGKSWETLLRELIFAPLGMQSAGFGPPGIGGTTNQPLGHDQNGTPAYIDNPPLLGPAGTVHMTITDWAKFIAMHLRATRGNDTLFQANIAEKIYAAKSGAGNAMGWLITSRSWGEGTVVTHSGSNGYWYSVVWMAPLKNFAVIVATNQGGVNAANATDEASYTLILHLLSIIN